jgi:hypothetical protein
MRGRLTSGKSFGTGAILFMLAGCGQILGVDDYRIRANPKADAGSPEAGAPSLSDFKSRGCGECVLTNCAGALTGCAGDEPCSSWEFCMAHCAPGNGACENDCYVRAGKTDPAMGSVEMCTLQYCYNACQASGALSAYGPGCAAATRMDCGTYLQRCGADHDCRAFWECLSAENCTLPTSGADSGPLLAGGAGLNPACGWFCSDKILLYKPLSVDGGFSDDPAMNLAVCLGLGADTYKACRLDNLACSGQYSYGGTPNLNSKVRVTVRVHEGAYAELPGNPLPSMQVRACVDNSPACAASTQETQEAPTGRDGTASFDLITRLIGLAWYFKVTPPEPWPTGPSAILFHTGRVLTQDTYLSLAIGTAESGFATLKDPNNAVTTGHWDSKRAGLLAQTRSCILQYARGLTIRVDGQDPGVALTRYVTPGGPSDPPDVPNGGTVQAFVGGIEPGLHTVYAYDGDRKISEQPNVLFEADELTVLQWFAPEPAGLN